MKRNVSRIKAMMSLYSYDLTGVVIDSNYFNDLLEEEGETIEADEPFYQELVQGVINHLSDIDRIIHRNIKNYSLERISYVDRNLIRIAVYEMLYTSTPKSIVINEILNITHEYSQADDEKTAAFNNSLLDRISKSIDHERS